MTLERCCAISFHLPSQRSPRWDLKARMALLSYIELASGPPLHSSLVPALKSVSTAKQTNDPAVSVSHGRFVSLETNSSSRQSGSGERKHSKPVEMARRNINSSSTKGLRVWLRSEDLPLVKAWPGPAQAGARHGLQAQRCARTQERSGKQVQKCLHPL